MPSARFQPARKLLTALLLVLLGACGGGGGGGRPAPPAGPLAGAANGLAKAAIQTVDTGDTYTPAEISVSPAGEEIIRTKLQIVFRPDATVGQVNTLLTDLDAVITTSIANFETVVVRIPDPGTLDALDVIVTRIETEPFVWFVSRAILPATSALPANIEPEAGPGVAIRHHLAVGAPGAWNAREALVDIPRVIVFDFFGDGPPNADLDYFYVGDPDVDFGVGNPDSHGYHVAGIIAGRFGGADSARGFVTGMLPLQMQLSVIDFQKTDPLTANLRLLIRLQAEPVDSKLIVNSSVGYFCTVAMTCIDEAYVRLEAAWWNQAVRQLNLEGRFLHVTAAGNVEDTADARDGRYGSLFNAAALLDDLVDAEGAPLPPLTNTLVIENVRPLPDFPYPGARCLSNGSFVNGHLGGVGTGPVPDDGVWSFTNAGSTADYKSGTSMATPQVAGLAAYLLAIRPGLTPQQLKAMLLETSNPVPVEIDPDCSDWPTPAPLIQAYPALLALDQPNQEPAAPVRRAILDINDSGAFTGDDIVLFLTAFETAQGDLNFGRADLNNDGRTGGGASAPFDLNLDRFRAASGVTQTILGAVFNFDETALTDVAILCYYAYSTLYTGSAEARDQLLAPYREQGQCGAPLAVTVGATLPATVQPGEAAEFELIAVDGQGAPVPGLTVEVFVTNGTPASAEGVTGQDGAYRLLVTLAEGADVLSVAATVLEGADIVGQVTISATSNPVGSLVMTGRLEIVQAAGNSGTGESGDGDINACGSLVITGNQLSCIFPDYGARQSSASAAGNSAAYAHDLLGNSGDGLTAVAGEVSAAAGSTFASARTAVRFHVTELPTPMRVTMRCDGGGFAYFERVPSSGPREILGFATGAILETPPPYPHASGGDELTLDLVGEVFQTFELRMDASVSAGTEVLSESCSYELLPGLATAGG